MSLPTSQSQSPPAPSAPIRTLVIFDTESTGLPIYEFNRTKITELSLVACAIEHIRKFQPTNGGQNQPPLPRVLHKLTVCLDPFRMIQPVSTELTGLDNFMLEHEQRFTANTAALLAHFLQQLPAPVCLVAHNGDAFDFPLLRRELDRVGAALGDDVRCVDSLALFRRIDEMENYRNRLVEIEYTLSDGCTDDQEDLVLAEVLERDAQIDWRKLNETTPHRSATWKRTPSGKTPSTPTSSTSSSSSNGSRAVPLSKRKLDFAVGSDVDGPQAKELATESPKAVQMPPALPAKRFRLQDVYERLFDVLPPRAHCAEADTLALLRCICAAREPFLALVDTESRPFADVRPLGR